MSTHNDILSLPSGAQWLKADLHVHTPASADIAEKWKTATPADVVRIAIEKGLDIIAVTDHNTAAWCDDVRQAAEGTSLTVLPGVEISTPQGHLLAIFDSTIAASYIEDLLIGLDISRHQFGSLHVATQKGIVDASASIEKAGGVAIAAHADGERGFLKMITVGAERERAYLSQDLRAIEILDGESRAVHQSGGRYPRQMTCLQSSDCWSKGADHHQLDGMANRYSVLKMGERSISGLKLALIDPDIRVRLAQDESPSPSFSILGMWVTSGFLDGQKIRFNENVNCLIGDTGSGKSVAIELLRFGLDQQPSVKKILSEVTSLLEQQLGNLGTVHILLSKGDTHYLVERAWGSPPAKPVVQRVTDTGLQPLEELDMRPFFPIKCFSQSEIIEFAREPEVRLSLTDDLIDCSAEFSSIEQVKTDLKKNAAEIIAESATETNFRSQLSERSGLIEAINSIDKILADTQITLHQRWYTEQKLFQDASEQGTALTNRLAVSMTPLDLSPSWPDDVDTLPNQDLLAKLTSAYSEWQHHVTGMKSDAEAKLGELLTNLGTVRGLWDTRFEEAESAYRELLKSLDTEGVGLHVLSERRRGIQEKVHTLDGLNEKLQSEILPRMQRLKADRERLLTQLQNNRRAITQRREEKAKDLSVRLEQQIRLQVRGRANTAAFRKALHEIAQGSRLQSSDLDLLATKCHPVSLVKHFLTQNLEGLSEQSGLGLSKLTKMWDTIVERERVKELYELQVTDVEDIIEVNLQVTQGTYRRLEDLSHGQKCMVVLMVALAEGEFPLLVDQPEDALHAPSIEKGIVSTLRSGRGTRQCIFATRNANILVSADTEQIIALEADAQNGHVAGTGSLDRFDHRQLVIYHVEGGEQAFSRRQTMYSLEPSF